MSGWAILGSILDKGLDFVKMEKQHSYDKHMARNSLSYRVQDARRNKIHPLAALGANVSAGSTAQVGQESTFSRLGQSIDERNAENQLKDAQVRNIDAQTKILNHDLQEKLGQSKSDLGTIDVPKPITKTQSVGIETGIQAQMKYEQTPEGNFVLLPRDNEAYSDEAPITTQAQFLWDDAKRKTLGRRLLHNWWKKSLQRSKRYLLESRPPARTPKHINLWVVSRGGWSEFIKTEKNKDWIFDQEIPGRNLKGGKKHAPRNNSFIPYS